MSGSPLKMIIFYNCNPAGISYYKFGNLCNIRFTGSEKVRLLPSNIAHNFNKSFFILNFTGYFSFVLSPVLSALY
jgi:hypothetical protein